MFAEKLPHIILIVMDTAGAKRCSVYGHHRDTTPGLKAIAREGALYRHSFAPSSWTVPSHASLFCGLYPSEHGIDEKTLQIPEMFHTLPEVLQQMGYHTAAISSNGLVNFQRGFDVFYEMDTLFKSERYHQDRFNVRALNLSSHRELERLKFTLQYIFKNNSYAFPLKNIIDRLYKKHCTHLYTKTWRATKRSFKIAEYLVNRHKTKQPLFIFMNLMESHWKYNPPFSFNNIIKTTAKERQDLLRYDVMDYYINSIPPEIMEKIYLLYQQGLFFLDHELFQFYRSLETAGVKDDTLFIVTSDHGESLGEHGIWGHMFGVYNETLHIPLVVKYPAGVAPPGEVLHLAQLNDLYATILEMAEVPLPMPESSRSLLGPPREFAFAEHYNIVGLEGIRLRAPDFQPLDYMQPSRAVIDPELWKLIEWEDGRRELYDLNRDYDENRNLIALPEQAPRAAKLLSALTHRLGPFGGRP